MQVREYVSLKPFNTFNIAAKASAMIDCQSEEEVLEAVRCVVGQRRVFVLGGGSNVLFLNDFDGVVLRPLIDGIDVVEEVGDETIVSVGAGVTWDDFVEWSVTHGLYGAENLSGIPGNVGASPVQNIGAYGVEAKDVIESVRGVRLSTAEPFELQRYECAFGYRDSIFKRSLRGDVVITRVVFRLAHTFRPHIEYGALRPAVEALGEVSAANVRKAVIATRNAKLPDPKVLGNAGSFFKNPEVDVNQADAIALSHPDMPRFPLANGQVKIPAGWLIERSGWKGRSLGQAAVHDRQALVLVNKGDATADDIVRLCEAVRADVKSLFGIDLTPEVNFVG